MPTCFPPPEPVPRWPPARPSLRITPGDRNDHPSQNDDQQDEHQQDQRGVVGQDQAGGRPGVPEVEDRVGEEGHRLVGQLQRRVQVGPARGVQQRRGLAYRDRDRHQHSGDHPGQRGLEHDLPQRPAGRDAERLRALTVGRWHTQQRRLGRLGDVRNRDHREYEHGRQQAEPPVQTDHQGEVTDEPEDDRRDPGQHLVAAAEYGPVPADGELGQVEAGEDADRAADDQHPDGDHQRAEDRLLEPARVSRRGVRGQHAPLEVRDRAHDDPAGQPDRGADDDEQGDPAEDPEHRVADLPARWHAGPVVRQAALGRRGLPRGHRYSPLPTGSAVPETRRTSSRAITFAARVINIRIRASSANALTCIRSVIAVSRFCTMFAAMVIIAAYRLVGSVPSATPQTMATAMVSPSARPRPSTAAPTRPAPTHGRVTLRAACESDMPRAIAPSRGSSGTPRIRSRAVDATIGITMIARIRPEVSRPWPFPGSPWQKPSPGQLGTILMIAGEMWWAMNGPKVSAPHRPMITLGMPASSSMNPPMTLAARLGSRSTIASAAPIDTGTAMIRAIADVASVPRISGSAPNSSPARWVTPSDVTGVPYCAPKFQVFPVKMCHPANLIAGMAWRISVISTKNSMSRGTTAPPRPSHMTRPPLRTKLRSEAPGRRRGGVPAPPLGTVGGVAAIRSLAEGADQALSCGQRGRRQRHEAHR